MRLINLIHIITPKAHNRIDTRKGFSLTDLLIGMTISVILTSVLFSTLHNVSRTGSKNSSMLSTSQDVIFASEWITRDANMAYNFREGCYPDYGTFLSSWILFCLHYGEY